MPKVLRTLIIVLFAGLLSACETQGIRDIDQVAENLRTPANNEFYFFRNTGFVGSGAPLYVVNGDQELGALGHNETLIVELPKGAYQISARPHRNLTMGTVSAVLDITQKADGPRFFIIGNAERFLRIDYTLTETTESSFRAAVSLASGKTL